MNFIKELLKDKSDKGIRVNLSIWGTHYDPSDHEDVDYKSVLKDDPMVLANFGVTISFDKVDTGFLTPYEFFAEQCYHWVETTITLLQSSNRTETIEKRVLAYNNGPFREDVEALIKVAMKDRGLDDLSFFFIIMSDQEKRVFIHMKVFNSNEKPQYTTDGSELFKELL